MENERDAAGGRPFQAMPGLTVEKGKHPSGAKSAGVKNSLIGEWAEEQKSI
jgi:hypothetical protein